MRFKRGDFIRRMADNALDQVKSAPGDYEYDQRGFFLADEGITTVNHGWEYQKDWEPVYDCTMPYYTTFTNTFTPYTWSDYSSAMLGNAVATGIWSNYQNSKKPLMKKLGSMIKRVLDKETQTLYKADYLNGDLELTEKGKRELLGILYAEKKAELVKLAEEELKEEKENKE